MTIKLGCDFHIRTPAGNEVSGGACVEARVPVPTKPDSFERGGVSASAGAALQVALPGPGTPIAAAGATAELVGSFAPGAVAFATSASLALEAQRALAEAEQRDGFFRSAAAFAAGARRGPGTSGEHREVSAFAFGGAHTRTGGDERTFGLASSSRNPGPEAGLSKDERVAIGLAGPLGYLALKLASGEDLDAGELLASAGGAPGAMAYQTLAGEPPELGELVAYGLGGALGFSLYHAVTGAEAESEPMPTHVPGSPEVWVEPEDTGFDQGEKVATGTAGPFGYLLYKAASDEDVRGDELLASVFGVPGVLAHDLANGKTPEPAELGAWLLGGALGWTVYQAINEPEEQDRASVAPVSETSSATIDPVDAGWWALGGPLNPVATAGWLDYQARSKP